MQAHDDGPVGKLPYGPVFRKWSGRVIVGYPERVALCYFFGQDFPGEVVGGIDDGLPAIVPFHFPEPLQCGCTECLLCASLVHCLYVEDRRKVAVAQCPDRAYEIVGLGRGGF